MDDLISVIVPVYNVEDYLLSKGCSGADFLQAIHNLAERYGITDEMTKNFLVYNFQKEKTQNGKKR